jgi:hypothetical protein
MTFASMTSLVGLSLGTEIVHAFWMSFGTIVHHCPYCELRFSYMAEVKDHILSDHKVHAESFVTVDTPEQPHPS